MATMGKIIGIDLGTTNSVVAIMEGEAKVIANEEGARTDAVGGRLRPRGDPRRPDRPRQAITNPENTVFSVKRFMGRKFDEVGRGDQARPVQGRRGANGDAWIEIRGKKVSPPEISAHDPAEAEAGRRGVPGRDGDRGGHHRARVLQRLAAPGDQGRRQDRRPRRQAHHQRADRGRARLRPRQEEGRDRSPSTTSAAAPSTSRSSRSARSVVEVMSTNGDTHLGGDDIDQRSWTG